MKVLKLADVHLEPCPFCGSQADIYWVGIHFSPYGRNLIHTIRCRSLECTGEVGHLSLQNCVRMWNKRVSNALPMPCELGASKLPKTADGKGDS
jgi:hypothetical protein